MSTSATEERIYAIGDSHVRTYSYHERFLPLYIGPGFANCFLTVELAAATEAKILLNLERLPENSTVLLSLGEPDVRFHAEDRFGTRSDGDSVALRAAVTRYGSVLERIGASANVQLAVLSVPPSVDAQRSRLAQLYNGLLAERCAALGVTFVDLWSQLVTPEGLLQANFDADGIHLTPAILPALSASLRERGLAGETFPPGPNFAWAFNYRVPLGAGIETRFWGNKVSADRAERLVEYVLASAALPLSAAVLECREGYVALALAARGVGRIYASDASPAKRALAQEVLRFARMPQVRVLTPEALEAESRSGFSLAIEYGAERRGNPDSPHLQRVAALARRAVVVAPRAALARDPGLADGWRLEEAVFGPDADEIILDTQRN